jgi:trehalose 6-phosphate synthase/phosphatase
MEESNQGRRLIVVSNRLPFQLLEKDGKVVLKESDGGLVSALKSFYERQDEENQFTEKWWIGSAEFPEKRWNKYLTQGESVASFRVDPIFINSKIYNSFYNGFCNATLWPLFHYFPSFVEFDEETFKCYDTVNKTFADKLVPFLRPNDILWIHDYQLMLLPGMIRERLPDATIGFFLHVPFPSFEVFRMLHRPWKEKIVSGLLGADLIGFHTHEYVQHFLKTVQMVSGHDHQFRTIFLKDRVVKADLFPLGIDFEKFNNSASAPEVLALKESIRANFIDKKIIFSVDRLDYTKGITHRLSGFERFLELHPEWRGQVIFILVVVPSRQVISKYNERKKLIEEQIGRINGRYSTLNWQPIVYRYNHLSFHELCALYQVADAGLITPLRDGMNLVAKEYVASQTDHGVLILSELAGAANEMGEALLVNPMDREEVSQSILTALTMPLDDQLQKMHALQKRLKDYTVLHWVDDFLKQLDETKEHQRSQQTRQVTGKVSLSIATKFRQANKRHIFLDYDGTLVPFSKHPKHAIPGKDLVNLLTMLAADPGTDITIISGRDHEFLEEWFHHLPINLVAEHGAAMKMKDGVWKLESEPDQSWKPIIKSVLELYEQRSPGSFVEEKKHTLAWHYRNVDPELGFIRSRELLDNLHHMIRNAHLQVIDGNKVIEVREAGVDKGTVSGACRV